MKFAANFLLVTATLVGLTYWVGSAMRASNIAEQRFLAECYNKWEQVNGQPDDSTMEGIGEGLRRDTYCRRQYQIWRT